MSRANNSSKENNSQNEGRHFRLPMFVHIYISLLAITLITGAFIWLSSNFIMQNYIAYECDNRISNAVNSCQSFAEAFRNSLTAESGTEEQIRTNLLNSIVSSSDLSNEASIVLFEDDVTGEGYNVLWPSATYSVSSRNRAQLYLNTIIDNLTRYSNISSNEMISGL